MNRLCIFICMVCIGRINVAFIDKIVDPILSPVNQILDFVNNLEVEDVVGAINTIPELYSAIHDGPFIFEGSQSSEVGDLKNTLETCINKLTKIINPLQAFDELLTINVDLPFFTLPDSDDVIYTLLAVTLLPLKNVINTACDEGVEIITEIANKIIEGAESVTSRRRRMTEDEDYIKPESSCDFENINGELCDPEEVGGWYYDGTVKKIPGGYKTDRRHRTYRDMVNYAEFIITNPYDTSDTENYVIVKDFQIVFTMILHIGERVCQGIDGCMQDGAECDAATMCQIILGICDVAIDLCDIALDAAGIHDAEINNVKIDRIFKDRVAIIHNQKELHNLIQESILGVSNENHMHSDTEDFTLTGIKTEITNLQETVEEIKTGMPVLQETMQETKTEIKNLQTTVEEILTEITNLQVTEEEIKTEITNLQATVTNLQATVEEIKQTVTAPISAHYAPETVMAGNYIQKGEAETILIKINSGDLYVMIGVAFGFIVVFIIMAVMLTLKCCNGYFLAQNNSTTISKYDYSPSEVENINNK